VGVPAGAVMTVLELPVPLAEEALVERPALRLVEGAGGLADGGRAHQGSRHRVPLQVRHRVPLQVRRRRTLLVLMGLLLGVLALPLGGTGGSSHAPGSALAGTGHPVSYVVRPGDTLWTIAERVEPTADPRPLVARLTAQVGSDTVTPGERLTLP